MTISPNDQNLEGTEDSPGNPVLAELKQALELGELLSRPEHPATFTEANRYSHLARLALVSVFGLHSEEVAAFRGQWVRAFRPDQIPDADHGCIERSVETLDAAGPDGVAACNKAALEETLQILSEAILHVNNVGAMKGPINPAAISPDISNRPVRIKAFIARIWSEEGRKITRQEICLVAGYKHTRELERFQSGEYKSGVAVDTFERVLGMTPKEFLRHPKMKSPVQ